MNPAYGASGHYLGAKGEDYFSRQQRSSMTELTRLVARKYLPFIASQDTVLDFGCGGGSILSMLPGARKIGVEINPVARAATAALGIECFATLAEVPDGIADIAISNHALEHVPYPIEALAELRNKLKPSGRLVLVVPVDDWRAQRVYRPEDLNHHLYTWTPQLLGHTLNEAGFTVKAPDISIVRYAVHPSVRWVPNLFRNWFCYAVAVALKRRQLLAVMTR